MVIGSSMKSVDDQRAASPASRASESIWKPSTRAPACQTSSAIPRRSMRMHAVASLFSSSGSWGGVAQARPPTARAVVKRTPEGASHRAAGRARKQLAEPERAVARRIGGASIFSLRSCVSPLHCVLYGQTTYVVNKSKDNNKRDMSEEVEAGCRFATVPGSGNTEDRRERPALRARRRHARSANARPVRVGRSRLNLRAPADARRAIRPAPWPPRARGKTTGFRA